MNIGNYESIRIDVSAELELTSKDKSDVAYKKGFEHLDDQINVQLTDIQGILHPKSAFKTA